MSASAHGTSGPGGRAGFQPTLERLESSATKEKIDALLKELDRLGLGVAGGDKAHESLPTRSEASLPALERIKYKLQGLSDRVKNLGRMGTSEDTKDLSDLIDGIRDAVIGCEPILLAANIPGELPPPAPRACFGRKELIEKVAILAENLEPVALIGAGGIGKTSIALAALHHDRVKGRFGDNRRFIRCDQFPASRAHFLARLSKVIGVGVENPEDLTALRPLLSTKEMFIVLDNAESVLDPQGTNGREIYAVVNELCQFKTICLCITSRITTVPRYCKRPQIPTLSMEAARDIFYGIYGDNERSEIIDDLLQRLDFHALSITLLATTASDNLWGHERLAEEWDEHRAQVLHTDYKESLAATIELSLDSPTFRKLGPSARDLLEVVAFFPQGVAEKNFQWFFPTIPDRKNTFDKFCVLSLTHRSNGFVTMLAPIRDYLSPRDPNSSQLICATKDCYFTRLSVDFDPHRPEFGETQWIRSEDMNVEHLLDVFISIDANALNVWDACCRFMRHIRWYKPRQTILRSKIEGLPDDHPSKPRCLFELSLLFRLVGNHAEQKRLLSRCLTISREREDHSHVALTLSALSGLNQIPGLREEGMEQAEEALEIYKQLGDTVAYVNCLYDLARLLLRDDQVDAAENIVLRLIVFLPEKGQDYILCGSHRLLGGVYHAKGEKGKAVHHFETALRIASPFGWRSQLSATHYSLSLWRSKCTKNILTRAMQSHRAKPVTPRETPQSSRTKLLAHLARVVPHVA
ncbi:hypothetical protein BJ322DRAFT_1020694 [Thelephora terrestris]|uniref:NB-ARC domain-containing protein n=1 Tax=Thelephora terrestris TaxID=56493 RepID=A0A9P6HDP0_9AGAM|nr:hypothetical protein BJ322DRAFT_1020694 [Thelephora terrestris]